LHFSKAHEKYRKKLEITHDNEKKQRRAAEMEAGVATGLVMAIDDQNVVFTDFYMAIFYLFKGY
jgi:hypothetical protein